MDVANNNDKANYCVYISFDNNDPSICYFINYLKATFKRHGVYQLDDQSHRFAERIRVLVVVFSKDYKFYAPENLVNKRTKKDLVVIPVLHGVTVSTAWQQIAVLDQVTLWQLVLLYSDVLPAHVYSEERSEYEFIQEIARDVCEKLYPTEEVGIHRRQEEIQNLLCKQPWGVRTLGIFGNPHMGKTTLVTSLFRHMSGGYDASRLIKDFHTEYKDKRLETLDHEYLSETPMEKFDLNSVDSEPSHRKKRVLVALDDVRNAKDAKSYLGEFNKFGPGSLIIITSRNKQILEECQMSVLYELKGLKDEEVLKLLTRCVFGNDITEDILMDPNSMKEIECYNGNPWAIQSYAKEVKIKKMVEMRPALPDVCELFITGNEVSCEEDRAVLVTRDAETITQTPPNEYPSYSQKKLRSFLYNRFSKSMPNNRRVHRLHSSSVMRSLFERHLGRKHKVLLQGFHKFGRSFSNSGDHDLLEQYLQRHLTRSGDRCDWIKCFLDHVRRNRNLLSSAYMAEEKKKSGKHGRDQVYI